MENSWQENVKKAFEGFNNELSELNKVSIENINRKNVLRILKDFFLAKDKENISSTKIDVFENKFKEFVVDIIEKIFEEKNLRISLFLQKNKYFSYGFYLFIDNHHKDLKDFKFSNQNLIFLSLINYFSENTWDFYENERAIKLLLKYYPLTQLSKKDKEKFINTIYTHISYAGEPSDLGFAYNGISLISKYIKNLPTEDIKRILSRYEIFKLINNKVYRKQVFTIIKYSKIQNKEEYKFLCIDSLIIQNIINKVLFEKYKDSDSIKYYITDEKILDKEITIFENYKENSFSYWKIEEERIEKIFIKDDEILVKVLLNESKICLYNKHRVLKLDFNQNDWLMNDYFSVERENKLVHFISESDISITAPKNKLSFSLLYLKNYKGVQEQTINFDHSYYYDKNSKEVNGINNNGLIKNFYSKKINSLTCIVGKNGMGKTSTIDFLNNVFFKMINLINEGQINCENGIIQMKDKRDNLLNNPDCGFLVIVKLNDKNYFLSNDKNLKIPDSLNIHPWEIGLYKSNNELSKVIYFSNMLSTNQEELIKEVKKSDNFKKSERIQSLVNFRKVDYSETSSFLKKRHAIFLKEKDSDAVLYDKELCYQLVFLKHLFESNKFEKYKLKNCENLQIINVDNELDKTKLTLNKLNEIFNDPEVLKDYLQYNMKIIYFSSGEYARFSFFSKFFWFLIGAKKYKPYFDQTIDLNFIDSIEYLEDKETSLIFIDEGELYYHPEWQRNYIFDLIKMIDETDIDIKLQIVLTTNSPFMISDILNQDISYLPKIRPSNDKTFGQNIHTLLKENFFMDNTIGEFSKNLINKILSWISPENVFSKMNSLEDLSQYEIEVSDEVEVYIKIKKLIEEIGEPVYREMLLRALNASKWGSKAQRISELNDKKREIEIELEQIKNGDLN
ncbi:ATP-binding protein [Exiguobacterium acetylicum]|uniref:ATPase AAA-type core domain-containing protein n=1 Tax=Exiguobacterium acetylicum TaxID=41170 RepID=A0ABX8GA03_EXIAC|nr:ATP-binding protein [Exiguobacterium acetylicum]QWB30443.1 hypothetical protein KKI46_01860 [Exiguobacterium acetylicum]